MSQAPLGRAQARFRPFPSCVISISEIWLRGLLLSTLTLPRRKLCPRAAPPSDGSWPPGPSLLGSPWDGSPVVRQGPASCPRLLQGKWRSGGCPSWTRTTLKSWIIQFPTRMLPTAFAMLQERDVDPTMHLFDSTFLPSCADA